MESGACSHEFASELADSKTLQLNKRRNADTARFCITPLLFLVL